MIDVRPETSVPAVAPAPPPLNVIEPSVNVCCIGPMRVSTVQ
jgi:hypothetical protein